MNIEHLLNTYSLYLLAFGTVSLAILAAISLKAKSLSEENKKLLFIAIIFVTLIPTIVMAVSTVYVNTISSSGGPVHWHSDIEIYSCGKELDIKDPEGTLSNKIGSPTLHEHNDKRIHLEGVVMEPLDASLGNFFRVIGGSIDESSVSAPTNDGVMTLNSGDYCPDNTMAQLQVFAYSVDEEGYYYQEKLERPQDFVIGPFSTVPEGNCIIVEYEAPKERTDRLCRSYKVAEEIGKVKGGRDGN
jgi:hypothetical protein